MDIDDRVNALIVKARSIGLSAQHIDDEADAVDKGLISLSDDLILAHNEIAQLERQRDELEAEVARLKALLNEEPDPDPEPDPEPGGIVRIAGPNFNGILPEDAPINRDTLHQGLGIEPTHGMNLERPGHTLTVAPGGRGFYQNTRGGGESIVEDRSLAWFDVPESTDMRVSFDIDFPNTDGREFDFGWQSKAGFGLGGYHSGKQWPGGGTCHIGDWLIRPGWNQYRRQGRLSWYLYIYSADKLDDYPGWGTACDGGGYRKLLLLTAAPSPEPNRVYHWEIEVERLNAAMGSWTVAATINGELAGGYVVSLGRPCNWVVMSNGYGGSSPQEGPNYPTRYMLSNLQAVDWSPQNS